MVRENCADFLVRALINASDFRDSATAFDCQQLVLLISILVHKLHIDLLLPDELNRRNFNESLLAYRKLSNMEEPRT